MKKTCHFSLISQLKKEHIASENRPKQQYFGLAKVKL